MTNHYAFAIILLVYVALPVAAWLVYWVWKRSREGAKEEGEGADSET